MVIVLPKDSQHRNWAEDEISACLDRYEYAPIIFIGSGISQRYISAPIWRDLLEDLTEMCPNTSHPLSYYEEEYDFPEIATELVEPFREWAWDDHETYDDFPPEIFEGNKTKDKYLKYKVSQYFEEISPDAVGDVPNEYDEEIRLLQEISPDAIITTNYDYLLETIYSGFERMVGQEIYEKDTKKVGDLFKIHGCASQPESLVLTGEDYDAFDVDKKYISSKLLTYFTEHPVLILGYSAEDDNIKRLLSELNRMVPADENDLIDNIFLVKYVRDTDDFQDTGNTPQEELINVGENQRIRVNGIMAHSFEWVYRAFHHDDVLASAEVEQLRKFSNKIYDITTGKAPRKRVNFERLEYFSDEDNIEKLLGFVPIDNQETVQGLKQAGIPIGEGRVSTEAVKDINSRLNTATQNYNSNGTLISDRKTVLEFRKRISDLSLSSDKRDLLIRSSLSQGLQGADWMLGYGDGLGDLFDTIINDRSAQAKVFRRLELSLLVLGETDYLEMLYDLHPENNLLKGGLVELSKQDIPARLGQYGVSTSIHIENKDLDMIDMYHSMETKTIRRNLDLVGDILIEETQSGNRNPTNSTNFRKIELVLLGKEGS